MKYIFVVGGVMSGVGKGTATASIGALLQARGFNVTALKIDPYINVDAGTMNPIEHGEVFVTDDGVETDQDLGNYERFLNRDILSDNYMTTGRVYQAVIERERNLEYDGRCVEVVPHIPNEVIRRIKKAGQKSQADLVLIEVGGTIGEYQNLLFLEAARIMHLQKPQNVLFVMVSYLPIPKQIGEMKTKPTQHAARTLNTAGIQADIILGRAEKALDKPRKRKISIFCNVDEQDVISTPDVKSIYEVPLNLEKEGLTDRILEKLNYSPDKHKPNLRKWKKLVKTIKSANHPLKIGIVGKYFGTGNFMLTDAYVCVIEAVKHAAWSQNRQPQISWLKAEDYEKNPAKIRELEKYDGLIVPGGFGSRGVEGKIKTITFARRHKIPFLGLCYGMQLAVVEFARNVVGLTRAHTTEINQDTPAPVIDLMLEQKKNIQNHRYGGTMRLGAYKCKLKEETHSYQSYNKQKEVSERHRHRFELNNEYRAKIESRGLVIAGINPQTDLAEIIELPPERHPFFVGTQFHPEFKSRPFNPHPLFKSFIKTIISQES